MKIISQRECEEWVKTKLGENLELASVLVGYTHSVTYHLPIDAGKKTALARVLSRSIDARQQGLLWITAWGIFPSSENMALFDAYRRSLGENRPIHETPGHVFDQSDLQQIECLLDLALYFYWDTSLFDGAGTIAVRTSHDEWISVYAKDEGRLKQFDRDLQGLKLKQLAQV